MIVRDEEALLPGALQSVRAIADELVVGIDDRTTDRTETIARAAGCRIHRFQWVDDFAAVRNIGLNKASKDWVLVIDADERLTPWGEGMIRAVLRRPDPRITGYAFQCAITTLDGRTQETDVTSARLWRNDNALRYSDCVHEQIARNGKPVPTGVLRGGVGMVHYGYDPSLSKKRDKDQRNLRLLEKRLADHPEDRYVAYLIAHHHGIHGRPTEAAHAARVALDMSGELHPEALIELRKACAYVDSMDRLNRVTQLQDAPTTVSLDEARAALAREWDAVAPTTPEQILNFYRTAHGLRNDLDIWHAEPSRQLWTDMLVHVAKESGATVVIDIGCGAGHDLRALRKALPDLALFGVEPNVTLGNALEDDDFIVYTRVDTAPIESADLLVCVDVLEHIPDPEQWLGKIAQRAGVGTLLFETTATFDCDTPLHLAANRGWHPGRVLERHGWTLIDYTDRVRVWKRIELVGRQTSSLLLCSYKLDAYLDPTMGLMGRTTARGPWRFRAKRGDSDIGRSRAIITTGWWTQTNDDTFLMIDHDMGFSPDDADRAVELCRNGYDIVCGAYPVHNGAHFACKTLPGTQELHFGPGSPPVEIKYAATGFMAVHRRVIDKLVTTMPLCHSVQPWAYYPLFPQPIVEDADAGGWARLSEDWGFSHIAREAGFKVWLDPQTILSHGSDIPLSVINMGAIHNAITEA